MTAFSSLLKRSYRISEGDVFFLTYDEPLKEKRWREIRGLIPHAKWVDGVKGFDRAHKECANRSSSSRMTIVDGDNTLLADFMEESVPARFFNSDYVLSWSAINSINGLRYGNGGVKSWNRETVLNMKTHENSDLPKASSDFHFTIPYYQLPSMLSVTNIHITPQQAFRAGFREGVKMSLIEGAAPSFNDLSGGLQSCISESNLFRLLTWLSVGADVPNGLWAILGARFGLSGLLEERFTLDSIGDFLWFENLWNQEIAGRHKGIDMRCPVTAYEWDTEKVIDSIDKWGLKASKWFNKKNLSLYTPAESRRIKNEMINPPREGLIHDV